MILWKEWLSGLLQMLVLVPSAISCYLPAKDQMRFSFTKTIALCLAVLVPSAVIGGFAIAFFNIEANVVFLPALLVLFFLYWKTVYLDFARTFAIYVGVCAIQAFPAQFANIADMYFKSETHGATLQANVIHLCLASLLMLVFVHPARDRFSRMVNEIDSPKIWYSTIAVSLIFFFCNLLVVPTSYDMIRGSRLRYLFPALEICGLVLLIMIYVLFYWVAVIILERIEIEKRSQMLEMQAHQFQKLLEYMQRTKRLRHDFRHSVYLLLGLAKSGDIEGICAHLSEYEQRITENVTVNFCKNAALNAMFSYYYELAEESGIKTDWKIALPEPFTISEMDMAAMFGNMMENAIAACAALPEDDRYFSLTSEIRYSHYLYVVSTNRFDGRVRKGKDGYHSTKHGGRAGGLQLKR